jgi:NADH-quinone oxidoreductase subunit N
MVTPEINWLAILPELTLALGAAAVLLIEIQWKPRSNTLGIVAGFSLFIAAIFTVFQWLIVHETGRSSDLVEFSGMVVMDGMAVYARMALLLVTGLGIAAGWRLVDALGRRTAEAIAITLLATAGFSIMVAANNLIMMFLGLEVGSISLYVLAGLARGRKGSDEAAMKYFLLGSFASALFVYGVALLYAGTGEFGLLEIRAHFAGQIITRPTILFVAMGLMLVGLGFKISAAPFHSWAPDVYQGAPAGVVGYMAAVAKIAGFAALARVFVGGVAEYQATWVPVMGAVAALSMLVGAVFALVQTDVRRMLAYSGVAHAGFIMTGIVGGETAGVLFYVVVYALQLIGAFAVVTAVTGPEGAGSDLAAYRGLAARSPGLAFGFALLLFGMAGLPLTAGFVAKLGVFSEAWAGGQEWLVILAVVASVIALAFYLRVIVTMYMEDQTDEGIQVPINVRWALGAAVAATILWGVLPGSLLDLVADAFLL